MNDTQKSAYLAFVANFVNLLHERQMPYEQAKLATQMGASALLGAVLQIPLNEIDEAFASLVVKTALKRFYGSEASEAGSIPHV